MIFSPYSLVTIILVISVFMLLFILLTKFNSIVLRIPVEAVYVILAIVGLRLLLPFEISSLSYELNSYGIMAKLNNFFKYVVFELGSVKVTIMLLICTIWIIGAIISLFKYFVGYVNFCIAVSRIPEIHNKRLAKQLDLIYSKYSFKHKPKVIMNKAIGYPAEFGYFKQTIIINEYDYTDKELYYILLHELAHYQIKTNTARLCVKILTAVFWWNPIMHYFKEHFEELMEMYVDNFVVKNLDSIEREDYMRCLLLSYKISVAHENSSIAFINPMAKPSRNNVFIHRFEVISKKAKTNIPICISIITMALACFALTVCFVI